MERSHIRLRCPHGGPQAGQGRAGWRSLGTRAYGLVQGSAPHIPATDRGLAAVQVCTQAPALVQDSSC